MRKLKSQVDLFFLDLLYRFSPYTRFFLERNFYQSTKDCKLSQIELLKKKKSARQTWQYGANLRKLRNSD